jgi:hypothetical protein
MAKLSFVIRGHLTQAVFRGREVYPGSGFFHPGSRAKRHRIRNKEFKIFLPKKFKLSSRKYDPGCLSRIPNLDFLHPGDPGIKTAPDPRSGSATLDTRVFYCYYCTHLEVHAPPPPILRAVSFFALSPVFPFLILVKMLTLFPYISFTF